MRKRGVDVPDEVKIPSKGVLKGRKELIEVRWTITFEPVNQVFTRFVVPNHVCS